jgi:hypothetical protein
MLDGGKFFLRFQFNENKVITETEDAGSGIASEIAARCSPRMAQTKAPTRPFHLQKCCRESRRQNFRPQRGRARRGFLLHAAAGEMET